MSATAHGVDKVDATMYVSCSLVVQLFIAAVKPAFVDSDLLKGLSRFGSFVALKFKMFAYILKV